MMSCIFIFFTQRRDKVHFDKWTSSTQSTFYFVESFRKCAVYQIINKLFIYKQGRSYLCLLPLPCLIEDS